MNNEVINDVDTSTEDVVTISDNSAPSMTSEDVVTMDNDSSDAQASAKERLVKIVDHKAATLKKYLDDAGVTSFKINEIDREDQKIVFFGSSIEIKGHQTLPVYIVIDASIFTLIQVSLVNHEIINDDNKSRIYDSIGEENRQYKPFKLYIDDRGDLVLDVVITDTPDTISCDNVLTMLRLIIEYAENAYSRIMKAVWS